MTTVLPDAHDTRGSAVFHERGSVFHKSISHFYVTQYANRPTMEFRAYDGHLQVVFHLFSLSVDRNNKAHVCNLSLDYEESAGIIGHERSHVREFAL